MAGTTFSRVIDKDVLTEHTVFKDILGIPRNSLFTDEGIEHIVSRCLQGPTNGLVLDNVLSHAECEYLIEATTPHLSPWQRDEQANSESTFRVADTVEVKMPEIAQVIFKRISKHIDDKFGNIIEKIQSEAQKIENEVYHSKAYESACCEATYDKSDCSEQKKLALDKMGEFDRLAHDKAVISEIYKRGYLDEDADDFELDLKGEWELEGINPAWLFARYKNGGHFSPHTDGTTVFDFNNRTLYTVLIYLEDYKPETDLCDPEEDMLNLDYDWESLSEEDVYLTGGTRIFHDQQIWESFQKRHYNIKTKKFVEKREEKPEKQENPTEKPGNPKMSTATPTKRDALSASTQLASPSLDRISDSDPASRTPPACSFNLDSPEMVTPKKCTAEKNTPETSTNPANYTPETKAVNHILETKPIDDILPDPADIRTLMCGSRELVTDTVIPKRGRILVFYHRAMHEGLPAMSKYIIRTDLTYKRLKPLLTSGKDQEAFRIYQEAEKLAELGKNKEALEKFRWAFGMSSELRRIYKQ